jgi:hypothetical protein
LKTRTRPSNRLTREEFLQYTPSRADFPWTTTADNLVEIQVPKFKGKFGTSFCKIIRREPTFTARLDAIGSFVWKHCDGTKTVQEILTLLEHAFPKEKELDQRYFLFLHNMAHLGYIKYFARQDEPSVS